MFCEKAIDLLKRGSTPNDTHQITLYNDDAVRQVLQEMDGLFKSNMADANANSSGPDGRSLWSTVQMRHGALERNKRCLLAYLHDRMEKIKTMRWEFGSVLPSDIKDLLSEHELEWFTKYSSNLASYMRSIGEDVGYVGMDLTENLKPPKSLYIEVLCLTDYGKFELEDGDVIYLKKNSRHFLPASECQTLIRQGIFKQLIT